MISSFLFLRWRNESLENLSIFLKTDIVNPQVIIQILFVLPLCNSLCTLPTIHLGRKDEQLAMEREVTTGVEKYCCSATSACEMHRHLSARDYFPEWDLEDIARKEKELLSESTPIHRLSPCFPGSSENQTVNRNKERTQKKRQDTLNINSIFECLFFDYVYMCFFFSVVICMYM